MTVEELIEQLKEYPDDYTVSISKDNCDEMGSFEYLCINDIYRPNTYDKEVIIEVW